jgi:hypothetical protein
VEMKVILKQKQKEPGPTLLPYKKPLGMYKASLGRDQYIKI